MSAGPALRVIADTTPGLSLPLHPPFDSDVLWFEQLSGLLTYSLCVIPGCGAEARARGLCQAHHSRWRVAGKPARPDWDATAEPFVVGRAEQRPCEVPGCNRSRVATGLCEIHYAHWAGRARPDKAAFLARETPLPVRHGCCAIAGCDFDAGRSGLCDGHHRRWKDQGRPALVEFEMRIRSRRIPMLDLRGVGQPMRDEIKYGLQAWIENGLGSITWHLLRHTIGVFAASGEPSLLNHPATEWARRVVADTPGYSGGSASRLVNLVEVAVSDPEAEWERPVVRLDVVGHGNDDGIAVLNFGLIKVPWLSALARRWLRWRLSAGMATGTISGNLRQLARFDGFLVATGRALNRPEEVDRRLIEDFLAWPELTGQSWQTRTTVTSVLRSFLRDLRRHRWAALDVSAEIFPEDFAPRPEAAPRALPAEVLATLRSPQALARLKIGDGSAVAIRCCMELGLRHQSVRQLPFDCLGADSAGAPVLRYWNTKMRRERFLPISDELASAIRCQQESVQARFPGGCRWLLPGGRRNRTGLRPMGHGALNKMLARWLVDLDLHDAEGIPIRVTSHQFRHSVGTEMINNGVPQHVVQAWLDHDSPAMTRHYARLHDTTLRRHWEAYRERVNVKGEGVPLRTEEPSSEAEWMKQHLSRAKETLANGYCGRPIQRECPHPNACLTCPDFLTTVEFLPAHRRQLEETRILIGSAEAEGQARVAEMNRRIEANLVRIIAALDPDAAL